MVSAEQLKTSYLWSSKSTIYYGDDVYDCLEENAQFKDFF